jgi:hypothetical protein
LPAPGQIVSSCKQVSEFKDFVRSVLHVQAAPMFKSVSFLFVLMKWRLLIVCRDMALLEGSLLLILRLWQWWIEIVYEMKDGILLPVSMTILDCSSLLTSEQTKHRKHEAQYAQTGHSFAAFVYSCFGALETSGIRYLWVLAMLEL